MKLVAPLGVMSLTGNSVSNLESYQRLGAECVRLAHEATDPASKALLLEMAKAWVKLAELTARAAQHDDAATALEPAQIPVPEAPRHVVQQQQQAQPEAGTIKKKE